MGKPNRNTLHQISIGDFFSEIRQAAVIDAGRSHAAETVRKKETTAACRIVAARKKRGGESGEGIRSRTLIVQQQRGLKLRIRDACCLLLLNK